MSSQAKDRKRKTTAPVKPTGRRTRGAPRARKWRCRGCGREISGPAAIEKHKRAHWAAGEVCDARTIPGLSNDDYHRSPGWSHSQIELLLESPGEFWGTFVSKIYPRRESRAMDLGQIVHACLLDESGPGEVLAEIPKTALNVDGHRKGSRWAEWKAANAGKIQMKIEEAWPVRRMVQAVVEIPICRRILDGAIAREQSIFYTDPATGLLLRTRLDLAVPAPGGGVILVDVKTTRCRNLPDFLDDVWRWGYHRQAAWYWTAAEALGYQVRGFVFLAVANRPGYEVQLVELEPEDYELGRRQNRRAIDDLARRIQQNDWKPARHGELLRAALPARAYYGEP